MTTPSTPTVCGPLGGCPWTPPSASTHGSSTLPVSKSFSSWTTSWSSRGSTGSMAAWSSGTSFWDQQHPASAPIPSGIVSRQRAVFEPVHVQARVTSRGLPLPRIPSRALEGAASTVASLRGSFTPQPSDPWRGSPMVELDCAPVQKRRSLSAGGKVHSPSPRSPRYQDGRRGVPTPVRNLLGQSPSGRASSLDRSDGQALPEGPPPALPVGTWAAGHFDRSDPAARDPAAAEKAIPVTELVVRNLANDMCSRLFGGSSVHCSGCAERERQVQVAVIQQRSGSSPRRLIVEPQASHPSKGEDPRQQGQADSDASRSQGTSAIIGGAPRAARRSVGEITVQPERSQQGPSIGLAIGALDTSEMAAEERTGQVDFMDLCDDEVNPEPVLATATLQAKGSSTTSRTPELFWCSPPKTAGADTPKLAAVHMQPVLPEPTRATLANMEPTLMPAARCSDGSAQQVQVVGCPGDEGVSFCTSVGSHDRSGLSNSFLDSSGISSGIMGESIDEGVSQGRELPRPSALSRGVSALSPRPGACGATAVAAGPLRNDTGSGSSISSPSSVESMPSEDGPGMLRRPVGGRPMDVPEDDLLDLAGWAAHAAALPSRHTSLRGAPRSDRLPVDKSKAPPSSVMPPSAASQRASPGAVSGLSSTHATPSSFGGKVQVPSARRGVYFPPPPVHANARVYHKGHLARWTPRGGVATPPPGAPVVSAPR